MRQNISMDFFFHTWHGSEEEEEEGEGEGGRRPAFTEEHLYEMGKGVGHQPSSPFQAKHLQRPPYQLWNDITLFHRHSSIWSWGIDNDMLYFTPFKNLATFTSPFLLSVDLKASNDSILLPSFLVSFLDKLNMGEGWMMGKKKIGLPTNNIILLLSIIIYIIIETIIIIIHTYIQIHNTPHPIWWLTVN